MFRFIIWSSWWFWGNNFTSDPMLQYKSCQRILGPNYHRPATLAIIQPPQKRKHEMSKKVPKSPQSNQQNKPSRFVQLQKPDIKPFQKLPSSSKTKACGSSNSGNVPKPPTNTSHRLPFKGHHRLIREASQTTIETSSPLDGNKRNAWLEGGFNEFWCVFVFGWLFWILYMYGYSECWCIMMCTYIYYVLISQSRDRLQPWTHNYDDLFIHIPPLSCKVRAVGPASCSKSSP